MTSAVSSSKKHKKDHSEEAAHAPINNAISVRSTMIKDIPSVPVLEAALLLWARGEGELADRDNAFLARELSLHHCHFCGAPSNETMALSTPWQDVVLCACLHDAVIVQPTPVVSDPVVEDDASEKPTITGYTEVLVGWQERIEEFKAKASKGVLRYHETVYENRCHCGCVFPVSVGLVMRSLERFGSHMIMNKCKNCHTSVVNAVKAKEARQTGEPTKSNAAKPTKNKKKKASHDSDHFSSILVSGSPDAGRATLGDALKNAVAELEAAEAVA